MPLFIESKVKSYLVLCNQNGTGVIILLTYPIAYIHLYITNAPTLLNNNPIQWLIFNGYKLYKVAPVVEFYKDGDGIKSGIRVWG